MAYSPSSPDKLTALQRELLSAFFEREARFFLTGGGALAGFYFAHRTTEDLDLFSAPGPSLEDASIALVAAAEACGAQTKPVRTFPEFRRLSVERPGETCIVDLVIDRAPSVEPTKAIFGKVRVDTLREIAANKVCTLIGRSEIKDLVDLERLVAAGIELEQAVNDAQK
jgi:predicted nucleotidyltransferase component of viral defense system